MGKPTSFFSILSVLVFLGGLTLWSGAPGTTPAEHHVRSTIAWSIGGATALNSVCAIAGAQYGLVEPPGAENIACLPYAVPAALIIARIHSFATGGYTEEEWAYFRSLPSQTLRSVEDAVQKALGRAQRA